MTRTNTLAAAAAAILLISSNAYATATAKAPPKQAAKAVKTAKAAPAAAAAASVAPTQGQLDAAARVYTGAASCEFDQTVHLAAIDGKPGHFKLSHKKASCSVLGPRIGKANLDGLILIFQLRRRPRGYMMMQPLSLV